MKKIKMIAIAMGILGTVIVPSAYSDCQGVDIDILALACICDPPATAGGGGAEFPLCGAGAQSAPGTGSESSTLESTTADPATADLTMTVTIEVADREGKVVRTLVDNREIPYGFHVFRWDRKNDEGEVMGAGNYTAEITQDGVVTVKPFYLPPPEEDRDIIE